MGISFKIYPKGFLAEYAPRGKIKRFGAKEHSIEDEFQIYDGVSGITFNKSDFQRMITDCENQKISTVL